MRRPQGVLGLAAAGLALLPREALACSVCFFGKEDVLIVYLGTALAMSVLPLALIGGLTLWLRRRLRTRAVEPAGEPRV